MSSALWLLLYLAPLLGLTAVVFAWFGWRWRGTDLTQRIQELEVQAEEAQKQRQAAELESDAAHKQVTAATAEATARCEKAEKEIRSLQDDLQGVKKDVRLRADEAAKAQENVQAREVEISRLLRDLEALRGERDHANTALSAARAELEAPRVSPTTPPPEEVVAPVAQAEPPPVAEKPKAKRKTSTTPKPKKAAAAAPVAVSLRDKITGFETQLAPHLVILATLTQEHDDWLRRVAKLEKQTPPDPAGLGLARRSLADSAKRLAEATSGANRLQSQIAVLQRVDSAAASLAQVPDDDLTQIKGIKKVIRDQLHAHGIRTWRQIASWSEDEVSVFSELLAFKNRAKREKWQEQARALHEAAHGPLT